MRDPISNLIVIEQLPVITERLAELSKEIDSRTQFALSLAVTEETVKSVKALRAELTKELTEFENRRKQVKEAIMAPYDAFEGVYKRFVSGKYRDADAMLKTRIDEVEDEIKARKRAELADYFNEYRESVHLDADLANMERWNPNVTQTATIKSLKVAAKSYLDRICDDLVLISKHVFRDEIIVEYRATLNASKAIIDVVERHKAIEHESELREAQNAATEAERATVSKVDSALGASTPVVPLKPPVAVVDDPVKTLTFEITAPLSKLRVLKRYLVDNGYIA
jgi:hypothetical protein